jgi:Cu-processing system permease protein
MQYILTIMRLTFQEALRRRVVVPAVGLSLVFLILYALGFWEVIRNTTYSGLLLQGTFNMLLLAGLYVVHFLTVVLAIFVSADALAGDIATHTIQAMVTKPMRRWQLLAGKWCGCTAMIAVYVGFLAASILIITYCESGYVPPHVWAAFALPILEATVLVSLSLLVGTYSSTMTTGVALLLLYGLAFIGQWTEQAGSLLQSPDAVKVGIVTSLVMPVEALWRRAAYLLQPPVLGSIKVSPFYSYSVPSTAMVVYAAVYSAVALALAIRAFTRRDL